MNSDPGQQLRPLPIRPRPRATESIETYVRRLARANHLRPSYLHDVLSGPYQNGRLRIERLAAVSGRETLVLQRTLTGITAPRQTRARGAKPNTATKANADNRTQLFAAIRRDRQREGLSKRRLALRHKVSRRTINQALASPKPPRRKQVPKRGSRALGPATDFIDAIMNQDLIMPAHRRHTIRQIWERLQDHHDITVAYSTVRDYVLHRRKELASNKPSGPAAAADSAKEHPVNRLDHELRSAIRTFASHLANGTLDRETLAGIDYRPHLADGGSGLEMAFAVFANVLTTDKDGHITNQSQAQSRAAQWIRAYCSPGYQIEPPLQDWETELI